jgi:hypothetical protein
VLPESSVNHQSEPSISYADACASSGESEKKLTPSEWKALREAIRDQIYFTDYAHLTRAEKGKLNKATSELAEVGATPEDIGPFFDWWADVHPNASLTPMAIAGHWSQAYGDIHGSWRKPSGFTVNGRPV